jgi:hypothetical protein
MALISRDELERASRIGKTTRHCDLAVSTEFDQEFIRRLDFPALEHRSRF